MFKTVLWRVIVSCMILILTKSKPFIFTADNIFRRRTSTRRTCFNAIQEEQCSRYRTVLSYEKCGTSNFSESSEIGLPTSEAIDL